MDSSFIAETAAAWWRDFLAVAETAPLVAAGAFVVALLSLMMTRSIVVFVAAIFLGVAAVFGSEPVDDPLKRQVFVVGCLASVLAVSLVAMLRRLELRQTRGDLKTSREMESELRARNEAEIRWRKAGHDERTPPDASPETDTRSTTGESGSDHR